MGMELDCSCVGRTSHELWLHLRVGRRLARCALVESLDEGFAAVVMKRKNRSTAHGRRALEIYGDMESKTREQAARGTNPLHRQYGRGSGPGLRRDGIHRESTARGPIQAGADSSVVD
jgi:hypothetical protein